MSGGTPGASTLFPFGQDFQNFQPHWGTYAVYNDLPNRPGNVLVVGKWENLRVGQLARVAADSGLYICDSTGVAGGGNAVWLLIGPAGSMGVDHFAPRYLVGNTLAPYLDPAVPQAAPFVYFGDPGDGSGIAAALAAAAAVPGDVWIRPGDFDLEAGAVVTPLVIPPGCTVRGSGVGSTRILGRSTGNQGVFVLTTVLSPDGRITGLCDLAIDSPAAADGTGVSTAVVRCIDATTVRDVTIAFAPNNVGAITDALSYEITPNSNFPASNLDNVIIIGQGDGTGAARAIRLLDTPQVGGPTVIARAVQCIGGTSLTIAIFSTGGAFVCQSLVIFNWTDAAIAHVVGSTGGGTIRIDEAFCQTGVANLSTIGFSLQGGGHVLRSILLQGSAGDTGIRLITPNGVSDVVQVEDCSISGWVNAIIVGSVLDTASAQDVTITDSQVNASGRGIWFSGPSVQSCHILDNDVRVFPGGSQPPLFCIAIEDDPQGQVGATSNFIKGNTANLQTNGNSPSSHAIVCGSQATVVEGNNATVTGGGYAIELPDGAERVTVTGNVTQAGSDALGCIHVGPGTPNVRDVVNGNNCTMNLSFDPAPGTQAAIVYEGQRGTVNNNTVFMGTPSGATPGILLTAVSGGSTAIGNVCEGSGGIAVTNLGALNEVAHNIGA